MSWIEGWGWKIYLILFSLLILGNAISLFYEESYLYIYYNILITFDKSYLFYYYYAVLNNVLELAVLVSLFLYVFKIRFLAPSFWQWIFVFRIVFDLVGHHFEFQTMKSLYLTDLHLALATTGIVFALMLPSYLGSFQYAFRQHKIFQ